MEQALLLETVSPSKKCTYSSSIYGVPAMNKSPQQQFIDWPRKERMTKAKPMNVFPGYLDLGPESKGTFPRSAELTNHVSPGVTRSHEFCHMKIGGKRVEVCRNRFG